MRSEIILRQGLQLVEAESPGLSQAVGVGAGGLRCQPPSLSLGHLQQVTSSAFLRLHTRGDHRSPCLLGCLSGLHD